MRPATRRCLAGLYPAYTLPCARPWRQPIAPPPRFPTGVGALALACGAFGVAPRSRCTRTGQQTRQHSTLTRHLCQRQREPQADDCSCGFAPTSYPANGVLMLAAGGRWGCVVRAGAPRARVLAAGPAASVAAARAQNPSASLPRPPPAGALPGRLVPRLSRVLPCHCSNVTHGAVCTEGFCHPYFPDP